MNGGEHVHKQQYVPEEKSDALRRRSQIKNRRWEGLSRQNYKLRRNR